MTAMMAADGVMAMLALSSGEDDDGCGERGNAMVCGGHWWPLIMALVYA